MSLFRTNSGGRVDRNQILNFSFEGKTYQGLQGDSLASALLANGVHFVARSYKYHRPRGIMSAGSEEANALVGIDRGKGRFSPSIRATSQELFEGLVAKSQHCWPSLRWDVGEINRLGGGVIAAGFYYKTFMWPRAMWEKLYEPVIRAAAGLGRAPTDADPDHYDGVYAHCEMLIVGAGPAGLSAALVAASEGKRIILVDEQAEIGGDLLASPHRQIEGKKAWDWLADAQAQLEANPNVTILRRTSAFGYYDQNFVALAQRLSDHLSEGDRAVVRERLWRVRAQQVVLATGAIERPLVFGGNDRPGIMLASAARTYLHRYGVLTGRNPVVVTSNDSAYEAAFDLARAGAKIQAIVDLRQNVPARLKAEAKGLNIEILGGHAVSKTNGRFRVKCVEVAKMSTDGSVLGHRILACDSVLMSGGWTPSVHLFSQSRGRLVWDEEIGAYVPGERAQKTISIGACKGSFLLAQALNDGAKTGKDAKTYRVGGEAFVVGENAQNVAQESAKGLAFVDFQHDVSAKDIRLAVREGFHSIEHIKRYTTTGMATDQGKTSNLNGLAIASNALGRPVPEVGLTTFRPPYTPTTFGTLAGHKRGALFELTRKSPIDAWAENNGAVFEPVGQWRRACYFPQSRENMAQALKRECAGLRNSVGMVDVSTLGKIEVGGPDAGVFLDRLYSNPMARLGVGRCRYGLMLGENGFIFDDGVVGRLDQNRFHVTTTTGGAARVFAHMQDYRQTEWPELEVWLTSITEQWAAIALGGPKAREVLMPHVEGIDLGGESFPHMSVRTGRIFGVPTRLFRISFTGELGFEINIPARYGLGVWEKLMAAGARLGITAYGTEAIHVLRAEKGYIIVGQDTEGAQTPSDVGMAWAVGRKKTDFVGLRAMKRADGLQEGRKHLVGLLSADPGIVLEEGAQIIAPKKSGVSDPPTSLGFVTSSYWSETLQRSIGMALIENGGALLGQSMLVAMPEADIEIKIVDPCFYDPEGKRLNG